MGLTTVNDRKAEFCILLGARVNCKRSDGRRGRSLNAVRKHQETKYNQSFVASLARRFRTRKICTYHAPTGNAFCRRLAPAETSRHPCGFVCYSVRPHQTVNSTARTLQTDIRPQRPAAPTGSCFPERREIGFVGLKTCRRRDRVFASLRFAIAFWVTVGLWSATVWPIAGWC
jgi:hypothetical protein